MNAQEVVSRLRMHFPGPAFCFLEQVADGTGARQHRWADAVAMSVWPSRGYDIHGIEVKVSRYDWKKELEQPEKSAAVQQYCNRWWIATPDESIIHAGELPPTWGWMVTKDKGMRVVREAPPLDAKKLSVEFVASILRNVQKADEAEVENRIRKACDEARETSRDSYRDRYKSLQKACQDFEQASGIRLNEYSSGADLGEAVATLRRLKYCVQNLSGAIQACADIQGMLTQVQNLAAIHDAAKAPPQPPSPIQ